MKNFLINVSFVILVFAVGFLAVRVVNYQVDVRQLQGRVEELERGRVLLQQQLATSTNQVPAAAVNPEDIRHEIEQTVSTRRGMDFKQPVVYQTVSPERLQQIAVAEALADWTPQEAKDYVRALEAFGLIPGGTDLTNILANLYDERLGAHYNCQDKTLYLADNLDLTQNRGRVILSREIAYVLQDQAWSLANLLRRVKDNDDQTLARTAFIRGDVLLVLTRMYSNDAERSKLLKEIGGLVADRGENLRDVPSYIRDMLLFPYQDGFRYAMKLEGRWQYGFQWPVTTEQVFHPEKARLMEGKQKDPYTPLPLVAVDSTSWRLIGNNVLGEFGIRYLLSVRLRQIEAEVAADGWNGDRYHVYARGINGPTGIIWRTIWDTEIDAEEFEEAYREVVRKTRANATITRDGVFVTVVQSGHPSFDALAQESLRLSGATGAAP